MYQVIKLGKQEVPMSATAATAIYYKSVFNEDMLLNFGKPDADTMWIARLAFIMAMQGKGTDMKTLNEDAFIAWLDTFDPLDLYGVEESNLVIELFSKQQKTTVETKKKDAKQSGK